MKNLAMVLFSLIYVCIVRSQWWYEELKSYRFVIEFTTRLENNLELEGYFIHFPNYVIRKKVSDNDFVFDNRIPQRLKQVEKFYRRTPQVFELSEYWTQTWKKNTKPWYRDLFASKNRSSDLLKRYFTLS